MSSDSYCAKCGQAFGSSTYLIVNDQKFHHACFTCAACHQQFVSHKFQWKNGEPYHHECFKTLFHPKCEVCGDYIPVDPETSRINFKEIPFWHTRMCPEHECRARCSSCQRIEPMGDENQFEDLSDGRKLCRDCATTVVCDTSQVQQVKEQVWQFLHSIGINLPDLPVYLVEYATLNEHYHDRHAQTGEEQSPHTTRGMCMFEVRTIRHLSSNGRDTVPEHVSLDKNRSVRAILILHGMPFDLAAHVLAHEAMHAYFKLTDRFPDKLPLEVEEGVCQLMSFLYIKYKQMQEDDDQPKKTHEEAFRAKLRDFYIHQLNSDVSQVYGHGFRCALESYNRKQSLQTVVDHVCDHQRLP